MLSWHSMPSWEQTISPLVGIARVVAGGDLRTGNRPPLRQNNIAPDRPPALALFSYRISLEEQSLSTRVSHRRRAEVTSMFHWSTKSFSSDDTGLLLSLCCRTAPRRTRYREHKAGAARRHAQRVQGFGPLTLAHILHRIVGRYRQTTWVVMLMKILILSVTNGDNASD